MRLHISFTINLVGNGNSNKPLRCYGLTTPNIFFSGTVCHKPISIRSSNFGTFDAIQQDFAQAIARAAVEHGPRGVVGVLTGGGGWRKVAGEILIFLRRKGQFLMNICEKWYETADLLKHIINVWRRYTCIGRKVCRCLQKLPCQFANGMAVGTPVHQPRCDVQKSLGVANDADVAVVAFLITASTFCQDWPLVMVLDTAYPDYFGAIILVNPW